MKRLLLFTSVYGVSLLALTPANLPSNQAAQRLTAPANGPYTVAGNHLLDAKGAPYLMRGTQLKPFRLASVEEDNRSGDLFGAHSATTLSAIRLRFNMNAVRLPLDLRDSAQARYWRELEKIVRRANDQELLVILAADADDAFWQRCAAEFHAYANVIFAIGDARQISILREAGALQPIAIRSGELTANVLREVAATWREDLKLPQGAVMVNGLDLDLAQENSCKQIPADPGEALHAVQKRLAEFDAREVSWTISEFVPGKLIKDFAYHDASTLEDGWTCGEQPHPSVGMGRAIEGYLRGSKERGLFVVSGSGGMVVARGAFALAYGPVHGTADAAAPASGPPAKLGGIRIEVTDSKGVTRNAGMLWASIGWGQTNFVVPEESAVGPAILEVIREDGSRIRTNLLIGDTAAGFVTGHSCRGPAVGDIVETTSEGKQVYSSLSDCQNQHCHSNPIPISDNASTQLRIDTSGIRFAKPGDIEVRIDGLSVRVVSYGPLDTFGRDTLTIEIPETLRGRGEVDLICHVKGKVANAVRVRIG